MDHQVLLGKLALGNDVFEFLLGLLSCVKKIRRLGGHGIFILRFHISSKDGKDTLYLSVFDQYGIIVTGIVPVPFLHGLVP